MNKESPHQFDDKFFMDSNIALLNKLKSPSQFTQVYYALACGFQKQPGLKKAYLVSKTKIDEAIIRQKLGSMKTLGIIRMKTIKNVNSNERYIYLPTDVDYYFGTESEFFQTAFKTLNDSYEEAIK